MLNVIMYFIEKVYMKISEKNYERLLYHNKNSIRTIIRLNYTYYLYLKKCVFIISHCGILYGYHRRPAE